MTSFRPHDCSTKSLLRRQDKTVPGRGSEMKLATHRRQRTWFEGLGGLKLQHDRDKAYCKVLPKIQWARRGERLFRRLIRRHAPDFTLVWPHRGEPKGHNGPLLRPTKTNSGLITSEFACRRQTDDFERGRGFLGTRSVTVWSLVKRP